MTTPALYPLRLQPALKVKVWGGRKLETLLHKTLPTDEPYGEAWEMHDSATVINGHLAGKTVGEVLAAYGTDLVGEGNDPADGMPLLAKFLDAQDWLSVQVHPNDAQAAELEGDPRGKTEAWYIIAAEPGAKLVAGIRPGTTQAAMAEAIRAGTLEDLLIYLEVQQGDVLLNNAGAVHALGPGIVIYEIQQSSDVTYRLYDWNRLDLDGKPRQLHIEKGVRVSALDRLPELARAQEDDTPVRRLVASPYFHTFEHRLRPEMPESHISTNGSFQILSLLSGTVRLQAGQESIDLTTGETALIPACLPAFTLHASEPARLLRSYQPR
jgi:mannose-6-phosphate isomerase